MLKKLLYIADFAILFKVAYEDIARETQEDDTSIDVKSICIALASSECASKRWSYPAY